MSYLLDDAAAISDVRDLIGDIASGLAALKDMTHKKRGLGAFADAVKATIAAAEALEPELESCIQMWDEQQNDYTRQQLEREQEADYRRSAALGGGMRL